MPILHEYKCIVIHIPKTAGTSIFKALYANLYSEYPKQDVPKHATALEIKRLIGDKCWKEYFSFAFVRNPWDLMVSCYFWWLHNASELENLRPDVEKIRRMAGFTEFMHSKYGKQMLNEYKGNMWDWIADENGRMIVDFVARFENLEEDFKKICKKIGLLDMHIPFENVSRHRHYSTYYTEETKQFVAARFKKSIDMFDYKYKKSTTLYNVGHLILFAFDKTRQNIKTVLKNKFPNLYRKLKETANAIKINNHRDRA